MPLNKTAFDIGGEIGAILTEWRPEEGSTEDIADAVMAALERYNTNVAPDLESELRTIFVYLDQRMKERLRSM